MYPRTLSSATKKTRCGVTKLSSHLTVFWQGEAVSGNWATCRTLVSRGGESCYTGSPVIWPLTKLPDEVPLRPRHHQARAAQPAGRR
ncbi:hypothetical protein E2C01_075228 [Portunus trituberculatus]|uniref:Uncharacterized protein n=1 Tax=Portunus trituberculatus TaxID=210409 RepID=A0A5B7IA72_PORTR|nr:hypothetical protein [Portunus trituberculatus]